MHHWPRLHSALPQSFILRINYLSLINSFINPFIHYYCYISGIVSHKIHKDYRHLGSRWDWGQWLFVSYEFCAGSLLLQPQLHFSSTCRRTATLLFYVQKGRWRKLKKRDQGSKTPQPESILQPLVLSRDQTGIELNTENKQPALRVQSPRLESRSTRKDQTVRRTESSQKLASTRSQSETKLNSNHNLHYSWTVTIN